jgi:ABC-type molybdenum transport system ATPase subunit/photorepair protein PhrA
MSNNLRNIGVFGPTLSGKTTLAKVIARNYWTKNHIQSLCLDIQHDSWSESVWTTDKEDLFWDQVWKQNNKLIIVDDGSATINRNKDLLSAFTMLRHRGHHLLIIGHNGTDLLPAMRRALHKLYLFRQSEKASQLWAEDFTDKRILAAAQLQQYEFLYCELYQAPRKQKLQL